MVVEEVFERFAGVLRLTVAGVEIGTTGEHPFWVAGRGWVEAGGLRVGDRLVGRGGAEVAVEDRGEWVRMYTQGVLTTKFMREWWLPQQWF